MTGWKIHREWRWYFLLKMGSFQCHVSFQECIYTVLKVVVSTNLKNIKKRIHLEQAVLRIHHLVLSYLDLHKMPGKGSKSYSPKWWWNMVIYYSREWKSHLRKKTTSLMDVRWNNHFINVMTWNHPIKTSIYKWLFGFVWSTRFTIYMYIYIYTSSGESNPRCPPMPRLPPTTSRLHLPWGSRLAFGGPRSP